MTYKAIFDSIDFEKMVDHPNILIAAHFWDEDRYCAAKVCYRFMRAIDDLVDNYKSEHPTIEPTEQKKLEKNVTEWISTLLSAQNGVTEYTDLVETIQRFKIPTFPFEDFAHSMIYDIYHDGFSSLDGFVDYAMGASVAPAAVFVHLCGLTRENDEYVSPTFDVKSMALPCAIFSYLVHIIRDFVKDHTHHLNYFPDDLMQKNQLTRTNLLAMANGAPITKGFRNMIAEIYDLAKTYRIQTLEAKNRINPMLEESSRLSLEIIFELYDMVFERIDVEKGSFSTSELNPTASEIKNKVWNIIQKFENK